MTNKVFVILETNSPEIQIDSPVAEIPNVYASREDAVQYLFDRINNEKGYNYYPAETEDFIRKNGYVTFYHNGNKNSSKWFELMIIETKMSCKAPSMLNKKKIEKALQCLSDNDIEGDECFSILQALCYILMNEEIEDYVNDNEVNNKVDDNSAENNEKANEATASYKAEMLFTNWREKDKEPLYTVNVTFADGKCGILKCDVSRDDAIKSVADFYRAVEAECEFEKDIYTKIFSIMNAEMAFLKRSLMNIRNKADIINKSYEIVIKDTILSLFENDDVELDVGFACELSKKRNPLDYLYTAWCNSDSGIGSTVRDFIERFADNYIE